LRLILNLIPQKSQANHNPNKTKKKKSTKRILITGTLNKSPETIITQIVDKTRPPKISLIIEKMEKRFKKKSKNSQRDLWKPNFSVIFSKHAKKR
jgi:uncharacterized UBP type Zn finger protein